MRVVKPQGNARQEGYRGRLKSPQRDQYHAGKTRHGKSPKIRSKPLGPCFAAGKEHQREYGHGHASPDPRVKASSEQNKISRPKVHGTRGGRRRRHDRFRLRFRLVSHKPPIKGWRETSSETMRPADHQVRSAGHVCAWLRLFGSIRSSCRPTSARGRSGRWLRRCGPLSVGKRRGLGDPSFSPG